MLIEKFAKVHESFEPTWAYFEINTKHDFVLKPGGTQKILLFGVHLDLKLESKDGTQKLSFWRKIFLIWLITDFSLFLSEAIKACMPLDCESYGMIAHMFLESALMEGAVEEHK